MLKVFRTRALRAIFFLVVAICPFILYYQRFNDTNDLNNRVTWQPADDVKVSEDVVHIPVQFKHQKEEEIIRVSQKQQSFRMVIKVLTYNRLSSLKRSLESLVNSPYGGDQVDLEVWLDHPAWAAQFYTQQKSQNVTEEEITKKNNEQYKKHLDIATYLEAFEWPHGQKRLQYRVNQAGLIRQWVEAWHPSDIHEYALFVEDDVELSPFWYRFTKDLINHYFYSDEKELMMMDRVFGLSLTLPKTSQLYCSDKKKKLMLPEKNDQQAAFLYSPLMTWGSVLFPKPWIQFKYFFSQFKALPSALPIVDGGKPGDYGLSWWSVSSFYMKKGDAIWTPYFMYYAHRMRLQNFFPKMKSRRSLSISHQEAGENYDSKLGPNSVLVYHKEFYNDQFDKVEDLAQYNLAMAPVLFGKIYRLPISAFFSVLQNFKPNSEYFSKDVEKEMIDFISKYTDHPNLLFLVYANDLSQLPFLIGQSCDLENVNIDRIMVVTSSYQLAMELSFRGIPVVLIDFLLSKQEQVLLKIFMKESKEPVEDYWQDILDNQNLIKYLESIYLENIPDEVLSKEIIRQFMVPNSRSSLFYTHAEPLFEGDDRQKWTTGGLMVHLLDYKFYTQTFYQAIMQTNLKPFVSSNSQSNFFLRPKEQTESPFRLLNKKIGRWLCDYMTHLALQSNIGVARMEIGWHWSGWKSLKTQLLKESGNELMNPNAFPGVSTYSFGPLLSQKMKKSVETLYITKQTYESYLKCADLKDDCHEVFFDFLVMRPVGEYKLYYQEALQKSTETLKATIWQPTMHFVISPFVKEKKEEEGRLLIRTTEGSLYLKVLSDAFNYFQPDYQQQSIISPQNIIQYKIMLLEKDRIDGMTILPPPFLYSTASKPVEIEKYSQWISSMEEIGMLGIRNDLQCQKLTCAGPFLKQLELEAVQIWMSP